jgi:hypothetical protein
MNLFYLPIFSEFILFVDFLNLLYLSIFPNLLYLPILHESFILFVDFPFFLLTIIFYEVVDVNLDCFEKSLDMRGFLP